MSRRDKPSSSLNSRERLGLVALVLASLAAFGIMLWKNRDQAIRPSLQETAVMQEITFPADSVASSDTTATKARKHKKRKHSDKKKSKKKKKAKAKKASSREQETPRDIVSEDVN